MNNEEQEERRKAKGWNDPPLFTYDQLNKASLISSNPNQPVPIHKRYKYPHVPSDVNKSAAINPFGQPHFEYQSYSQPYSHSYQSAEFINHQAFSQQSPSYPSFDYQYSNYSQYQQHPSYQSQPQSSKRY